MSRPTRRIWVFLLCVTTLLPGCRPQQPFYFLDDGDLSHYIGQGAELEEPDVCETDLAEVKHPQAPRSLTNAGGKESWPLKLEEAVSITLANSKTFRRLGGRLVTQNANSIASGPGVTVDAIISSPQGVASVYLPAITQTLEENALSAFDPRWTTSATGGNESSPLNRTPIPGIFSGTQEAHTFSLNTQLQKRLATGGIVSAQHAWNYNRDNGQANVVPSTWGVPLSIRFEQPLLRFGGVSFNRIHSPVERLSQQFPFARDPQQFDGIAIARINTDVQLADFHAQVRNLVSDVEVAYWDLYLAYRLLDSQRKGRDSALATWKRINALKIQGARGGEQENWAQAKEQYYLFRGFMESALTNLYTAESRLRFIMGLAATDERLIKPADEPTTAKVVFNWDDVHAEALARSVDITAQKWRIKQRELELLASKNMVLPGLDAFAGYRWDGLGDHLLKPKRTNSIDINGRTAYESLTDGEFQTWDAGLVFSMQLGMRGELANVRRQELLLARERAVIEDMELEVSHQMHQAIRELQSYYVVTQTQFNRRVSAKQQVEAVQAAYEAGTATLDLLLDAQRRLADADSEYYRSLVNYNLGILNVHLRKNSLLEYNGIYLSEGPWPGKAYFDATRLARKRDASLLWNYGVTEPRVFSTGPASQSYQDEGTLEEVPTDAAPGQAPREEMPAPAPFPKGDAPPRPAQAKRPARVAENRNDRGGRPQPSRSPQGRAVSSRAAGSASVATGKFDWGTFGLTPGASEPVQPANYDQPVAGNESDADATPAADSRPAASRSGVQR